MILTLGAVMGVRLLVELKTVLLLFFVAVLFAAALSRPAAVLERRGVPRGLAVALVQALGILIVGALLWFVVPPLRRAARHRSPTGCRATWTAFTSCAAATTSSGGTIPSSPRSTTRSRRSPAALRAASEAAWSTCRRHRPSIVFDLVTIYVLATLMVTRRERLLEGLLVLVSPSKRPRTRAVMDKVWWRLGAYLRAKVIVMLIVGALMYVALVVLGVPFAVPLAVLVAFGELVPTIGPWIARIPLLTHRRVRGLEDAGSSRSLPPSSSRTSRRT